MSDEQHHRPSPSLRKVSWCTVAFFGLVSLLITGTLAWVSLSLRHQMQAVIRDTQSMMLMSEVELNLHTHNRLSNLAVIDDEPGLLAMRDGARARMLHALQQAHAYTGREDDEEERLLAEVSATLKHYLASREEAERDPTQRPYVQERTRPLLEAALAAIERSSAYNENEVGKAHAQVLLMSRWASIAGVCGGGVLIIVLILGVFAMRRYVVDPVSRLRETIERFRHGDVDARAELGGAKDISLIACAFNQMSDTLAQQRSNQLAFLAGVAHDLKSPLSALKLGVHALALHSPPTNDDGRRTLAMFERQIDRLSQMAGDFLDIAKIDAGQLELEVTAFDLRQSAEEIISLYAPLSPAHELILRASPHPVVVRADSLRIEQVIGNLVDNAIKYSPRGGPIAIAIESGADEAVVSVTDRGIGVDPSEIASLFMPFHRRVEARNIAPGAGLGLSTIQRIVRAHGGRIEVESAPQAGSTFRVHLPLATAQPNERRHEP